MFCASCGANIADDQRFCSACGRPVQPVSASAPAPEGVARGRVGRHLQIVAILWFVWSALRLIPGFALLFFGHFALPFLPFGWRALVLPIAAFAGLFFMAFGVAGLIAAWGLLQRRTWARILMIVLAIISLIHFPLGTALGIYTLWVLLPAGSDVEYRRLCGVS
ncbi:MAG: zinc-ribbon domain-containing protein [Terriglobia bacterium]